MFIMVDDDNYYFLVIQSDVPQKTYDFKASIDGTELTEITKEKGAYGYTNWQGVTTNVDLYTITVLEGTESVDFVVDNPVLAYNYGKNPCTDDDYLAGATPDYMTGNAKFSTKIDSNGDGKIDFIQVQTPYDSAYNSTLLYAVTFKYKTYGFEASADGKALKDVETAEGAYSYTNWQGTETKVALHTVTIPEGTTAVDLKIENPVLAYNYKKNPSTDDDYLAGAVDDYMTGSTSFNVKVDYDGDGAPDFIQVQTPYDASWNTSVLYAITFKYAEPEPAPEPAAKALAAPKIKAQLISNSKVKVTWGAVKGATSYKVSYKANGAKKWTTKTAKGTNLTLTGLKPGKTYQIKAAAVGAGGTSKDSNIAKAVTLAKVKGLKVRKNGVKYTMSWKKVSTAKGYQKKVYTSTTKKWNNIKKGKKLGATKFRTIRFFASKNYKYKVRAYKKVGSKMIYGPWSTAVKAK